MPREAWRDDPEYLGLWRMARQQPDDSARRLVLADWLEEHGHFDDAWRERLHGLTDSPVAPDPDTGIMRVGTIPMGQGVWGLLRTAPPAESVLTVFDRDVQAYQYLRQYQGRCGWDVGLSDWSSRTERAHLLAVPRLEMFSCQQISQDNWDWIMDDLRALTYLEIHEPAIAPSSLARLMKLPQLRGLMLLGSVCYDTTAIDSLPGLSHLAVGPYTFEADELAEMAPEAESLHADPGNIGSEVYWPRLRSLQMLSAPGTPLLETAEVMTVARHEQLERLNIRCGELSAKAIKALAGLPQLRELTLRLETHRLSPMKAFATAPKLESLTIEGLVGKDLLAEVAKIAGLRVLRLGQVKADGRGLAALAEMPALEEVQLHGEIKDASALPALSRLPRLAKLDVKYLELSEETVEAVKSACPPWVECLVPEPEA